MMRESRALVKVNTFFDSKCFFLVNPIISSACDIVFCMLNSDDVWIFRSLVNQSFGEFLLRLLEKKCYFLSIK